MMHESMVMSFIAIYVDHYAICWVLTFEYIALNHILVLFSTSKERIGDPHVQIDGVT